MPKINSYDLVTDPAANDSVPLMRGDKGSPLKRVAWSDVFESFIGEYYAGCLGLDIGQYEAGTGYSGPFCPVYIGTLDDQYIAISVGKTVSGPFHNFLQLGYSYTLLSFFGGPCVAQQIVGAGAAVSRPNTGIAGLNAYLDYQAARISALENALAAYTLATINNGS